MMAKPKLLLLDEPSMGLAPRLVQDVMRLIRRLNDTGTTILLVEQNARLALKIANTCSILESGRVILQGEAAQLREDDRVVKAYLGA